MPTMRRLLALAIPAILILATFSGCGSPSPSPEPQWREEVADSLLALETATSYRYHLSLENWVGVSGQSVYGDEKGEGSWLQGDFSAQLLRTSPAGDGTIAVTSKEGRLYLQEDNAWLIIKMEEIPNPLCDPRRFPALASGYGSISLEGDEERGGKACRRYLLQLDSDLARDALGPRTWSYFSSLRYELNCRIWVSDPSAPPASMRLEVVGFDPDESLQRYRLVATLDPYDIDSPDIHITAPEEK